MGGERGARFTMHIWTPAFAGERQRLERIDIKRM